MMENKQEVELLNIDFVEVGIEWNYKNISSPYYRIFLVLEADAIIKFQNHQITLEANKLYLIPPYINCWYICNSSLKMYYLHFTMKNLFWRRSSHIYSIEICHFDMEIIHRLCKLNPNRNLKNSDPIHYEEEDVLASFKNENKNLPPPQHFENSSLIKLLFSRFNDAFEAMNYKNELVSKSIETINQNIAINIPISQLADKANVSTDHFIRLFKNFTGETPLQYINKTKIEHAQLLMLNFSLSIQEIGYKCGFESPQYFSRVFKSIVKKNASEYRKDIIRM